MRVHFPRRNQGRETHQKQHGRIKAVRLNGEAGPDIWGPIGPASKFGFSPEVEGGRRREDSS